MKMEGIRRKTQELLKAARVVGVVAISGTGVFLAPDFAARVVFGLAIPWALAGQYFLQRGMWSATMPADAGLSTGVEYYRREIDQRRNLFAGGLRWMFGCRG
jgi:hypothetical protein